MGLFSVSTTAPMADVAIGAGDAWNLVTRLGESQILLPAMLVALLWMVFTARTPRAALHWAVATTLVTIVTTASKVAFFGFEVGYAPWNYTGVSGHAMFAAAVWPVLAALVAGGTAPRVRHVALAGAYALAALLAYSRVRVGAHSVSEALAGFALGGLASGLVLWRGRLPESRLPWWLLAGLAVWFLALPVSAPASPTHGWVVRLSLAVSDRPTPYTRREMRRDWHLARERARASTQAPPAAR